MRQMGGGRRDTCSRLGRQVGLEESLGGSGWSQGDSVGGFENSHSLNNAYVEGISILLLDRGVDLRLPNR